MLTVLKQYPVLLFSLNITQSKNKQIDKKQNKTRTKT